jgi:hypothetical protein
VIVVCAHRVGAGAGAFVFVMQMISHGRHDISAMQGLKTFDAYVGFECQMHLVRQPRDAIMPFIANSLRYHSSRISFPFTAAPCTVWLLTAVLLESTISTQRECNALVLLHDYASKQIR